MAPRANRGWRIRVKTAAIAALSILIAEPVAGAGAKSGFTSMPAERTGVDFTNRLSPARALANHILLNGSGVALGDVDGDGRPDLFLAGLEGASALYRNLGDWRFTNVTASAFAPKTFAGMDATGAVLADLDGDGRADLVLNGVGAGTRVFMNREGTRFVETTAESGLGGPGGPTTLALADIDADGDLDVYVVRYRTTTVRDEFQQRFGIRVVDGKPTLESVNGRSVTEPDLVGRFSIDAEGRVTENGEADGLYRNDGRGRFTLVPFTGGAFKDEEGRPLTAVPYDWGLAAMFRDINGDGRPDLYVCNDLNSPDRVWINDGAGGFRAIGRTAIRKTSWFSMGIDFGDLDRDGHDDFLVTDMLSRDPVRRQADVPSLANPTEPWSGSLARPQVPRNTLQVGRGDGTFAERAWMAGLAASDWSWSPVFLDVDLDGWEDVLITTGFERDVQDADVAEAIEAIRQREKLSDAAALELRRRFPPLSQPNLAFRNRGGLRFEEVGTAWGFNLHGISQGAALADLDDDGDLDVVLNNQNAAASLLRNDSDAPRVWVRLRGRGSNVDAVGARIEVEGGPVRQAQVITSGGRFLSGDAPGRTFAAGTNGTSLTVTVTWPRGGRTVVAGVKAGERRVIDEPADIERRALPAVGKSKALFEDRSAGLNHRHVDMPFDESGLQPLLPRSLASLGPGLAWADLDLDGRDDLVIGAGHGGRLSAFLNDGKGGFRADDSRPFAAASPADQAGVLVRAQPGRRPEILVALSNYESPRQPGVVRTIDMATGAFRPGGIRLSTAPGPMAMADVDGDGALDLFLGGRVIGGRFPESAGSAVLRGGGAAWVADPANTEAVQGAGMVSGAAFTDLDADGDPDLVVACDWGPIRIYSNDAGRLVEKVGIPLRWAVPDSRPRPLVLEVLTGWWNSVLPVDVDGDGLMDLVAGNWGRNSRHQVEPGRPAGLRSGDLAGTGSVIALETFTEVDGRELPWVLRDRLAGVWPSLTDRFPTRAAFGAATVVQVLGDRAGSMQSRRASTLESVVLRNRGDHWVVEPLPDEAQVAPVFGIASADFDGDGHEDLFLAQNHFGVLADQDRQDAGLGLILLGDGSGGWRALRSAEAGIGLPGEQRTAAVSDFDADGRPDLVVTQAGEQTHLYRNAGGRPGLRVRLAGPAGNPTGVGTQLRAVDATGRAGPAREIRMGAGYWSQDGAVQVMAGLAKVVAIEVRWPARPAIRVAVPDGMAEVTIGLDGAIVRP